MTAPCHGVRRRERGSCGGSSGRAASASRIASLASSRATNVLCPKPQLRNQTFAKSGNHLLLRLAVKPWQSEARTNRDSPDAGRAPGPALQLHRVGDIPGINKMVPFAVSVPPAGTWPASWLFRSPLSCRSPRDDAILLQLPFFCASFAGEFEQEMDEFGLAVRPGLFKNAGELRAGCRDRNSSPFRRSLAAVALDDLGG